MLGGIYRVGMVAKLSREIVTKQTKVENRLVEVVFRLVEMAFRVVKRLIFMLF